MNLQRKTKVIQLPMIQLSKAKLNDTNFIKPNYKILTLKVF